MTSCYLFQFDTENIKMQINLENDNNINISVLDYENNSFTVSDNNLLFNNIWNNTDLKYEFLEDSIKEYIYLNSSNSPRVFNFKITGHEKVFFENDNLMFLDQNNNILYSIEKPYIIKDDEIYNYNELISHAFDKETNIYSVTLNCEDDLFPLVIDPSFLFYSSNYAKGEVYSGISKTHTIVVGSDSNNEPLEFSNIINHENKPTELLGSDLVTFNKNVNVFLDMFKKSGTKNLNVNSITVSGSHNLRNLFDSGNTDVSENINISLSAILMYIDNSKPLSEYNVSFSINNAPKNTSSITNNISLVYFANQEETHDTLGTLSDIIQNNNSFSFSYRSPNNFSNLDYGLIKIETAIENMKEGQVLKTTLTSFVYLQFVDKIYKEQFYFKENCAKLDFINSDFYIPTSNRGLAIIDSSLGIIRTIDENSNLPNSALNVYCANRIGTIEDPRGLLICTEDGMYYFCNKPLGNPDSQEINERADFCLNPYLEPSIYGTPIKISKLKVIDFVMSGIFIFLLTEDSKVFKFTYKTFLYNLLNKPLNINPESSHSTLNVIDISTINDNYIRDNEDKINIFDKSNFYDKESDIQYSPPYIPNENGGPLKLIPICVDSDNSFLKNDLSVMESAYFTREQKKLHGISILYNQDGVAE